VVGVVVLVGLVYFWSNRSEYQSNDSLENMNSSDEVLDIEADLESTDVENVDYDLNADNYNAS
jgi:hypothetical protein